MDDNAKVNRSYLVAVILMLLFIFNDLLFDFAFSFKSSDYIAFTFTLLSAIIVFICNYRIKNDEYKRHYYTTTKFIKSNFDNAQVVFSILDIVCGIISILSAYFYLACAFKFVKIFYVPVKVITVANKEKSLLKPIVKVSYFWTAMRIMEKRGFTMKNFLKSNKFTILIGILLSVFSGFAFYFGLPTLVEIKHWLLIVASVGVALVAFALIFFLGKDTVESLALRLAKKNLPEEKYNALVSCYNSAIHEVEVMKEAEAENKKVEAEAIKRLAIEEKKAEVSSDDTAKREFENKVNAKMAELRATKQNNAEIK